VKKINIRSIEVQVSDDDKIKLIYIPENRQILEPGKEYEIVIGQLQIKPAPGYRFEKE
jgi:hypothetical protein